MADGSTGGKKKPDELVRYGLRFYIRPNEHAVARAREVVKFCRAHRIREVHLFFNCEEWNRGHLLEPEVNAYLAMFRAIIPLFRKAGISPNLNPWTTLMHGSRGRAFRPGQDFERMIGVTGKEGPAVASFACLKWRASLAGVWKRMAELGFETIWIEDDFRYHNHGPLLGWGGDFSDRMLALFAERVSRPVTREEVVRNVLQPGTPHPWRKLWQDTWWSNTLQTAEVLRDAVAAGNPGARLGLMSSHPDVHSVEGRRWQELFEALAVKGRAVHRPNFATYQEDLPQWLLYSFAALDIQKNFRPDWVESYPEVDNGPHGQFSKSDRLTFAQMAMAKLLGSEGILLNLHPMIGTGVEEEPNVGRMLDRSYPALDWIARHFPRAMETRGVGVIYREDAAQTTRTRPGEGFENLWCRTEAPVFVLGRLGVACQMRRSDSVNVLWGQKAWSFSDSELLDLLKLGLWLDAEAAMILTERGFGEYLGISIDRLLERETDIYSVERIVSGKTGVRAGFDLSCNLLQNCLKFSAGPRTEEWTQIIDCFERKVGTGLSVFRNKLGGTVAVSAFLLGREVSVTHSPYNCNFQRRTLVQNLVRTVARGEVPVMCEGSAGVFPMDLRMPGDRKIALLNLWTDPAETVVTIPGAQAIRSCTVIPPLARPSAAKCTVKKAGGNLRAALRKELPLYGLAVLETVERGVHGGKTSDQG